MTSGFHDSLAELIGIPCCGAEPQIVEHLLDRGNAGRDNAPAVREVDADPVQGATGHPSSIPLATEQKGSHHVGR